MKVSEILRAAKAVIATEQTWTRGTFARDAKNRKVHPCGGDAVCFCAQGAIMRAANTAHEENVVVNALEHHARSILIGSIAATNDGMNGFRRIHEAFDQAILRTEREGS